MAKYEALCSFATIDKAAGKGAVIELDDVTAKDLLRAGYVKAVAAEEPVPEPVPKKTTMKKKAAKKG